MRFEDFDVGETYSVKLTLTNISYSVNSFQLLPSPTDAISFEYTPSGGLSPGLSTDLTVVFAPKTNRDWSGDISLLAQTGKFTIPVVCSRKRAAVSLSTSTVDLPAVVIGEATRAEVELTNTGALATQYRIVPIASKGGTQTAAAAAAAAAAATMARGTTEELAADAAVGVGQSGSADNKAGPTTGNDEHAGDDNDDDGAGADDESGISLVDGNMEGVLQAKSSVLFGVLFKPRKPGSFQRQFRVELADRDCTPLELTIKGACTEVPVQLDRDSIDLKICQINRVFSDRMFVRNTSATSSFKVAFTVPPRARKYIEVRPRTAVVQAGSRCKISVVLTPGEDMLRELGDMADSETCLVHVPVTMVTEGLAFRAQVTVHANVTPGDIEVSTDNIDFGRVAFTESVVVPLTLTNTSALAQDFAFTNCPDYIFVQPNSGFGTLLPFETLRLHVICAPQRHPHDDDDRVLKCTVNLEWPGSNEPKKIKCKAVGTLPPIRLSSNRVRFPPTCPGDERVLRLELKNVSTATRTFQFGIPKDSTLCTLLVGTHTHRHTQTHTHTHTQTHTQTQTQTHTHTEVHTHTDNHSHRHTVTQTQTQTQTHMQTHSAQTNTNAHKAHCYAYSRKTSLCSC